MPVQELGPLNPGGLLESVVTVVVDVGDSGAGAGAGVDVDRRVVVGASGAPPEERLAAWCAG